MPTLEIACSYSIRDRVTLEYDTFHDEVHFHFEQHLGALGPVQFTVTARLTALEPLARFLDRSRREDDWPIWITSCRGGRVGSFWEEGMLWLKGYERPDGEDSERYVVGIGLRHTSEEVAAFLRALLLPKTPAPAPVFGL